VVTCLVVLLAVGAGVAWYLLRGRPAWYDGVRADPAALQAAAVRAENELKRTIDWASSQQAEERAAIHANRGAALAVPYNHDGIRKAGARTTFLGNLSAGYYFTPHDLTPVGDLVWYVSTNLSQPTDDRGLSTTTLTFTPGFRTHLGRNWFLFGGVEVPATKPEPFDYQVLGELLKVF